MDETIERIAAKKRKTGPYPGAGESNESFC
jgi:hypothetical protein